MESSTFTDIRAALEEAEHLADLHRKPYSLVRKPRGELEEILVIPFMEAKDKMEVLETCHSRI